VVYVQEEMFYLHESVHVKKFDYQNMTPLKVCLSQSWKNTYLSTEMHIRKAKKPTTTQTARTALPKWDSPLDMPTSANNTTSSTTGKG